MRKFIKLFLFLQPAPSLTNSRIFSPEFDYCPAVVKGAADILRAGSEEDNKEEEDDKEEEDNKEEEDDNNLGIKAGPGPGRVKAFFPIVQPRFSFFGPEVRLKYWTHVFIM